MIIMPTNNHPILLGDFTTITGQNSLKQTNKHMIPWIIGLATKTTPTAIPALSPVLTPQSKVVYKTVPSAAHIDTFAIM